MNVIITSEQMKRLDNLTINDFGIPSRVLMENAGKGCADLLLSYFDQELSLGAVILCGYGNNGGDGYVIARWLQYYGYPVSIIKVGEGDSSPETIANRTLCEKLGIKNVKPDDNVIYESGVIIDAIYGIGFKGILKKDIAELISKVNESPALKIAIDLPSGVNADTGNTELAFQANITLTMEALKYGHLLGKGKQFSGFTEVIPIGIPDMLWHDEETALLLDESIVALPDRSTYSHKGDFGRIAVFGGSPGFTGAAFMASAAALKAGAGLVTIFCHPLQADIYDCKPYEVMVKTVPLLDNGKLDSKALTKELGKFDVILFGPGCGVSEYTFELLSFVAEVWAKPAVIDADGLNTLAQHPYIFKHLADKPIVLTPHWGEFCRLAEITIEEMQQNCLSPFKNFVKKHKLKVLLKSDTSIYYDTDEMYFNTTGNDGLATGGSGDVLSGMIAGFLAQKMYPADAAGVAAYYLGLTADHLAEKQETLSITPTDILNNIFKFDLEEIEVCDED